MPTPVFIEGFHIKQGDPGVRGPMGNPGKEGPKVGEHGRKKSVTLMIPFIEMCVNLRNRDAQ